ncbi:MAG: DUF930 domain-containing protein [Phyllobacterium sp.]
MLASIALHVSFALLLWFRMPSAPITAPEETIKVALVPPPQPKPEEKTETEPAKAEPAPAQPEGFESAVAKARQKTTETQLPPVAAAEASQDKTAPDASSPPAGAPVPSDAKGKPSAETLPDASGMAPENVPIPESKPPLGGPGASEPAKTRSTEQPNQLVSAQQLFSPESLSSFRVRQTTGKISPRARIMQLCTIEALEQVRRQRPGSYPDLLVPFGPSGRSISSHGLNARGGAFRSRGNWFDIDFKCAVDADRTRVTSFSFAIGGAIPRGQWNARQLPLD